MDMELSGKQAVVTGASRGIGLAIVEALVAEGVSVVAGARHRGALPAGGRGRRGRSHDRGRREHADRRRGRGLRRRARHPGQQRRRGAPAHGRLPLGHRRGVARDADDRLPGRGPRHPCGARPARGARRRHDRQRQLRQRQVRRSAGDRLLRGQGGAGELLEVAGQGGRAARHSRQHGQPGTGRDRSVARRRRGGGGGRAGRRGRARGRRGGCRGAVADRPLHAPGARWRTSSCCWRAAARATRPAPTS